MKPPSRRSRLKRLRERGSGDPGVIEAILAEGLVCHVGFAVDGQPFVIPMAYAPWEGGLLLHGSVGSRLLKVLASGAPACVTVTLLDGVVFSPEIAEKLMQYLSALTDDRARDLSRVVPVRVPSRLPVDRP